MAYFGININYLQINYYTKQYLVIPLYDAIYTLNVISYQRITFIDGSRLIKAQRRVYIDYSTSRFASKVGGVGWSRCLCIGGASRCFAGERRSIAVLGVAGGGVGGRGGGGGGGGLNDS